VQQLPTLPLWASNFGSVYLESKTRSNWCWLFCKLNTRGL